MRCASLLGCLPCLFTPLLAQETATFERVDNAAVGLAPATLEAWGQAIADIDGNGWQDIFTRRWGGPSYSRIYLNDGGIFQDISGQTPLESLEPDEGHTRTVALVDYDNDGDKDIFFGTDDKIFLLRNDDNFFTDIAASVGFIPQKPPGLINRWDYNTGAWTDIDLDGDLDVVISQSNNPNFFVYRNDQGTFSDIASEVGLAGVVPLGTDGDRGNWTARMHWVDYDMDGDLDLSAGHLLFRNDDGQFAEVSESVGLTPSLSLQNSDWFDYDNDGDFDFLKTCTHFEEANCGLELWENQNGTFTERIDVINTLGVLTLTRGLSVGDYDNDGDEDVFLCNAQTGFVDHLLLNEDVGEGERVMDDIAEFIGLDDIETRKGGAFMDYDNDGFLDLYVPSDNGHRLYHNLANSNNWLGLILEGVQSNRDALGAVVRIVAGGQQQIRFKKAPSGWNRQDMPAIHFGLGQTTSVDSLIIRWPLGKEQVLTDVGINQYHTIQEPGATSVESGEISAETPLDWRLHPNYPNPFNPGTTIVYDVPAEEWVIITIYNPLGKEVTTVVNRRHDTGRYSATWDGRNKRGLAVNSGVYFVHMQAGPFVRTHTMTLLK